MNATTAPWLTTWDTLNAAYFWGEPIAPAAIPAAREVLIAALPTVNATAQPGLPLFTGEPLRTRLAARAILTTETVRLLRLLGVAPHVTAQAETWLAAQCYVHDHCTVGECAHAGLGWLRCLAAGDLTTAGAWPAAHLALLAQRRDANGRWRGFPFYYTLLVLTELELPAATAELQYAAPACRRAAQRSEDETLYTQRRREIVARALARSQ